MLRLPSSGRVSAGHIDFAEKMSAKFGEAGKKVVSFDLRGVILPGVFWIIEIVKVNGRLPGNFAGVRVAGDLVEIESSVFDARLSL